MFNDQCSMIMLNDVTARCCHPERGKGSQGQRHKGSIEQIQSFQFEIPRALRSE
jgi:hypothetical protein